LETTTIEETVVLYAVCSGNNRAAVFSMRSVPATIGKTVYTLYNNGKQRCYAATVKVFSLWSDHRLYKACYRFIIQLLIIEGNSY
jgi:hypothetical protein